MAELVEGAIAPLFEAESVDGRYVRLERYLGYSHILLVLLGGARQPRRRHVRSLASHYPLFVENDAEIIAVCAEPAPRALRDLGGGFLPFPFIADPVFELGETYGQRRTLWTKSLLPAQFLICKRGLVRFVEYGKSAWDQTPPTWILNLIRKI